MGGTPPGARDVAHRHGSLAAAMKEDSMAKKDNEKTEAEGTAAVETSDSPLLDMSDAAVKRMIKLAKKRGFVTYRELNAVLPSEEAESEEEEEEVEGGELVEMTQSKALATQKSEPADRTDDPVRMYLREMGSVELLSREGEIAIAKR